MQHIDPESLAALPRGAGVYIFKGEGTLPLYIGKSVDIRSRVLAHLRAPDEAEMIAQTRRVDFVETAGEIGALLLEAHQIKLHSPLYNIRLRRLRRLCTVQLEEQDGGLTPRVVSGNNLGLGQADGLYGLFSSAHAAHGKLRELADQHRLCLGLLGLEKLNRRGCFGLQLNTCLGACVGREDRRLHDQRLREALMDLKVHAWPYPGAVELVEENGDWVQRHRLRDWRYLGTWCSRSGEFNANPLGDFDLDTYKILVKPILLKTVQLELVVEPLNTCQSSGCADSVQGPRTSLVP